jgi:hypothetical protein
VQRVVELVGQVLLGEPDRAQQIRSADVTDEQRVAGHHAIRFGVPGMLVDHDAHRLRRVSGSVAELQLDIAQRVTLAVLDRGEVVFRLGHRGIDDPGTGGLGQLQVPGQEVGVEVGLDDQLDGHAGGLGIGDVLADVPLRVDHHRPLSGLIPDQIRRVRQAVQVVLIEQHRCVSFVLGQSQK